MPCLLRDDTALVIDVMCKKPMKTKNRIQNIGELMDAIPEKQWIILDVLRGIVIDKLPTHCNEKISFNVPFFYGNKGICIIWPASIPRGGISEGVLFGFWQGNKLSDPNNLLIQGTNKKVYYKIYKSTDEIDIEMLNEFLDKAIQFDLEYK